MKRTLALPIVLSLLTASVAFNAHAAVAGDTAASPPRSQVRMERDEFLRTHQWNETSDLWTLKSGIEPPTGVKSRMEVKAARDEFLRNNKWDESTRGWAPLKAAPRNMSSLSRQQVRAETRTFMRTHTCDETTEAWVARTGLVRK